MQAKVIPVFFKALCKDPRNIGALCPSSKYLASTMAKLIPKNDEGFIVDLGAGTGSVTKYLLEHGTVAERIISIERDPNLAAQLKKKFPLVNVVLGDAQDIESILENKKIVAILSSLPLQTIPDPILQNIMLALSRVAVSHELVIIQFTYAFWRKMPLTKVGFRPQTICGVFRNIPPAIVTLYKYAPTAYLNTQNTPVTLALKSVVSRCRCHLRRASFKTPR